MDVVFKEKMPGFKTHKKIGGIVSLILGAIFVLLFYNKFPINDWRILFLIPFIVIIYSQIPDLDSYTSRIRKRALQFIFWTMVFSSILAAFINIWLVVILLTLAGMSGLFLLKVPHRGPLHTYKFAFIIAVPLLFLHWLLFILAFSCAASHIFTDKLFSKSK